MKRTHAFLLVTFAIIFGLLDTTTVCAVGIVRGPYLQNTTPSAVTIKWRTDVSATSKVWYGTSLGSLNQTLTDPSLETDHTIRISGLPSAAKYFYQVGTTGDIILAGGDPNHYFITSPSVGSTDPIRIWVLGDSGRANDNARAVRDAYLELAASDKEADIWLMLGDNAYEAGSDTQYQAAVFDIYPGILRNKPLWSTRGNHETSEAVYYGIFDFPANGEGGGLASGTEHYYSFDYGNVHFICLNSQETDLSTNPDSAMYQWLEQDLAGTLQEWIIAYWHHPPYSKGSHNSDSESQLIYMRQNALPILEAGGVDMVLSGHSHCYERSYFLNGHYGYSGSFDSNTHVVQAGDGKEDGDGAYQKCGSDGTVYIVAGSSGQTGGGSFNHAAMQVSFSRLGSLIIDVNNSRLDSRFLREYTGPTQIDDYLTIEFESCVADNTARAPNPGNGQTGVPVDTMLSWSPGEGALSHDVYFGTNFDDVYDGTGGTFKGNQTETTYGPLSLEPETTYYWRIDEVDDVDVWRGDVWSFTTSRVYYVDGDAVGANDGSNWANAYNDLQDGLAAAWSGDEIRVAQGIYKPDQDSAHPNGTGLRTATFGLINGVPIKGGYAGFGEPEPNARDIEAYETILSGDLLGDDGPDFANSSENSFHVVTGSGTNATAVLDGFIITGGNADGSLDITGDMISYWKFDEDSGTIAYDSAGNNHGTLVGDPLWVDGLIGGALEFDGAGDYVLDDDAEIDLNGLDGLTVSVWIKSNVIGTDRGFIIFTDPDGSDDRDMRYDAAGGGGGGKNLIKCGVTSTGGRQHLESSRHAQTTEWQHLVMTWSSGNQVKLFINGVEDMPATNAPARTGTLTGYTKLIIGKGGKDTAGRSWNGLIDDVRIYERALSAGEIRGLYFMYEDRKYGGGMYNDSGSPTITNCIFSGNRAEEWGGGMYNQDAGGSPTLVNCTFSGNWAMIGGGMFNQDGSSPTLVNCTFSGNSAGEFGGGIYNEASSSALTNCILWGNIDSGGMDESAQISGAAILNYCCIQGSVEPDEPSTQGLISHWKFDEDSGTIAYDSAGSNHGTVSGAQWTPGQMDGALSFDGFNDYVLIPNESNFDATDEITVAAWIKVNRFDRDWQAIVTKGDNAWRLHRNRGRNTVSFHCNYQSGGLLGAQGSVNVNDGQWHHLAGVYDGSKLYLYVDGILDASVNASGRINTNNYPVYIGENAQRRGRYWNGLIDNVRVYERALSAGEIWQFYLGGFGGNQGNIDSDPWFVEPGYWDANGVWVDGDFRLLPDSPCIDAGDNSAVPPSVLTDLGGNLRFVDQAVVPDTGNGTAPIVDMGAYEANYIEAAMKLTPRTLNCGSKGNWVKAHITLPEGFTVEDVDPDRPAVLRVFGFESAHLNVFVNENELVEIEAAFRREDICSLASDWPDSLSVYGFFSDGSMFFGTSTVRIITPGLNDIHGLAAMWLEMDCSPSDWCGGADLNEDSMVNNVDFALLQSGQIEFVGK